MCFPLQKRQFWYKLRKVVKLLLEVAKAVQFMHNRQLLLGSLKLDDVRIGRDGVARLTDFRSTLELSTTAALPNTGSARYALDAIDKGVGHVFEHIMSLDISSFGKLQFVTNGPYLL
jgi:hypothetical protein